MSVAAGGGQLVEIAMVGGQIGFDQRVQRLTKKHKAMSHGYGPELRSDGLIIITPRGVNTSMLLLAGVAIVAAFVLFKAFLLAYLGPDAYSERVEMLRLGTVVEYAGSWVMQTEPATEFLAMQFGPILRG